MTKLPDPGTVHAMVQKKDAQYEKFIELLYEFMTAPADMRSAMIGSSYSFSIDLDISDFNMRIVQDELREAGWLVVSCERKASGHNEYSIYFEIKALSTGPTPR